MTQDKAVCPNCGQWQHAYNGDCLNECVRRGFAEKVRPMAEGLKVPTLTQMEFGAEDFATAERIARRLGYLQTAYTSTSALWGLFCLPENPEYHKGRHSVLSLPPYRPGCIIKTREFGLMFIQTDEDLGR